MFRLSISSPIFFSMLFLFIKSAFCNVNSDLNPDTMIIRIDTVRGISGGVVDIPIRLENVPPLGINNCDFIVYYPSDVEILKVQEGDIIEPSIRNNFRFNIISDMQKIIFLFVDHSQYKYSVKKNGIFAHIKVSVKKTSEFIPFSISPTDFTDLKLQEIPCKAINGGIMISEITKTLFANTLSTTTQKEIATFVYINVGNNSGNIYLHGQPIYSLQGHKMKVSHADIRNSSGFYFKKY
jgi:hypothetical protein